MGINLDKPHLWQQDVKESVAQYNAWFMDFAPKAFRETRIATIGNVETALQRTNYLQDLSPELLREHPEVLPILRMVTCPPIARDRLVGLADVSKNLVHSMEDADKPRVSARMNEEQLTQELQSICDILRRMADPDLFPWLTNKRSPDAAELLRTSTIIADRVCGAVADPVIRYAQEKRQLGAISAMLQKKGYRLDERSVRFDEMAPGTFSFHTNVPVFVAGTRGREVNIPVDVAIMPPTARASDLPLLIEAQSAGDYANVNKRRKEEAAKMQQIRSTYGGRASYTLFLCGYFDLRYLHYEAAEGIDWIWEHRMGDFEKLGI